MNFDPNTGQPIYNGYQQPVQSQTPQNKQTNGFAIAGLVVSIALSAIIGIILSIIGLKEAKKTGVGKGMAVGGIIIGIAKILLIVLCFALPAIFFKGFYGDFFEMIKDPYQYCSQATYCGPEVNGYRECNSISEHGMTVTVSCPVDKIKMVDDEDNKCKKAYECVMNTKSDYLCKYKTEKGKVDEIKCLWTDIDSSQIKQTTTTTARVNTEATGNFLMPIEDVFTIAGRGTVATGRITRGSIKVNDEVQIIGLDHEVITTKVIGIEMFHKTLDEAKEGDNAGVLLEGVTRDQIERGQVIISPNSMNTYKKFDADIKVLTKEEGGRSTSFSNGYKPQFYFRTIDVTGTVTLADGVEQINPGDETTVTVELSSSMAMEVGTEFSIREGGRTIAKGTVTKVY